MFHLKYQETYRITRLLSIHTPIHYGGPNHIKKKRHCVLKNKTKQKYQKTDEISRKPNEML